MTAIKTTGSVEGGASLVSRDRITLRAITGSSSWIIRVRPGIAAGTVTLTWDKVKHALLYYLEYGVEGEKPVQISLSGRRKKKLTLPRLGAMYVFRIATAGTFGQSNWSAPVRRIAG